MLTNPAVPYDVLPSDIKLRFKLYSTNCPTLSSVSLGSVKPFPPPGHFYNSTTPIFPEYSSRSMSLPGAATYTYRGQLCNISNKHSLR